MGLVERLQKFVGFEVIIEYKTNSGDVTYAKGILEVDVEAKAVIVHSEDKLWFVDVERVVIVRVDKRGEAE